MIMNGRKETVDEKKSEYPSISQNENNVKLIQDSLNSNYRLSIYQVIQGPSTYQNQLQIGLPESVIKTEKKCCLFPEPNQST